MSFLRTFERRFGWLTFPGIIRYYALMHLLVYVLQIINPNIGQILDFDRSKILTGEVWRLFTCFFATSEFGGFGFLSLLFLICMVNFMFMVGDGLEGAWGTFKTSMFCYFGMLCILAGNFLFPSIPFSGLMMYGSAFLAFATLFPKIEIRLFLILPVQVRFLGFFQGAMMLLTCIALPILFPFYLLATLNYLLWAGFPALRGKAREAHSAQRRSQFKASYRKDNEAFHTCLICGRTEISHPQLEFRVGEDGGERCIDHLTD